MKPDSYATKPGMGFLNEADPVLAYFRDIRATEKLTNREELDLARRIREGDKRAMQALVKANLKFVVAVCRNYRNMGLPLADIINEGNLGMIRAALRFDENQNSRFITYAVWWIRQGILSALSTQTRTVPVHYACAATVQKINRSIARLNQTLGRQPSFEELELDTGMNAERIQAYLNMYEPTISLSSAGEGQAELGWTDLLAEDMIGGLENQIDIRRSRKYLEEAMDCLGHREKEVVQMFYGMQNGEASNLGVIAEKFGVSRERVRQLKKQGLAKMRRGLKRRLGSEAL